jgi:TetR/AcrR family transcriptional regulator, transcriptional repressor of aconitase
MPKVSDAHRDARRDQITAAALRAFAEKGFQRTSMADIIAESGLSAGAIYLHFESKQQIAVATARVVVGHRRDEIAERLRRGPLPDPHELIAIIMSGLQREIRDSRLLVQMWAAAVTDPEIGGIVTEIIDQLRGQFLPYLTRWAIERRGSAPDDAAAWARTVMPALLGLSQGYIVQAAVVPDFVSDDYLAAVRTLFA